MSQSIVSGTLLVKAFNGSFMCRQLVSFPGAGSAGLGLFADCSANLNVPFEDLNPNAIVFEQGDVICYAHRPRINRLVYNDNYGYWTNRYLIWSQTKLSPM